jgi:NTP pyrophosphatase (non-canonical NTP hydrolase)
MGYPNSGLSFSELRAANQDRLKDFSHFTKDPEEDWSLNDWAVAAAGEMGEMCNLAKKLRRGEDISAEDIGKEIADTITYLDFVAWKLGLDTGSIVQAKFNEVSRRIGSSVRL